jgi:hypothetical protein
MVKHQILEAILKSQMLKMSLREIVYLYIAEQVFLQL